MSEPFLGEVRLFGFNFPPSGWAQCNGQLLAISQNTALFALLGTYYGGNGTTTFGLPDLRGRVPMHMGQGPGLTNRTIGEQDGVEVVTLTINEMPSHNHSVSAEALNGNVASPSGAVPAKAGGSDYSNAQPNTTMSSQMIGSAGGSQPHQNLQPSLVLNWCIALQGIFPSRN